MHKFISLLILSSLFTFPISASAQTSKVDTTTNPKKTFEIIEPEEQKYLDEIKNISRSEARSLWNSLPMKERREHRAKGIKKFQDLSESSKVEILKKRDAKRARTMHLVTPSEIK